jgi:6-phosphogluconate dehydrogenase
MSSGKAFRVSEAEKSPLVVEEKRDQEGLAESVRAALELSIINAYAQGFQLLDAASKEEGWNLNLSEIARIWRGGCIIRSELLKPYQKMFAGDQSAAQSVRDRFAPDLQKKWRNIVSLGALRGIPLPAMSASLSYYDSYRTARLPQNLIQAQRDLFGAHTFQRMDMEGVFHVEWE